ncbi:hypothetical protein BLNAU_10007 [Blattamonas nauphoetae]|uniref:Uncharacterized protein n=1 Tax=Blattamonas nauphoetae TaxID=2049346 RepID=A0ABQ9XUA9_9EUKA|nr:hypothetical protein BLNAU_10007 [Blattamonas nauphoetae]
MGRRDERIKKGDSEGGNSFDWKPDLEHDEQRGEEKRNCTNHLSGTAIVGMGDGGSVLSHNTSFIGCHTPSSPNEESDTNSRLNDHFNITTEITSETPPNHVFTLCTFKECTTSTQGGAICADNVESILKIEQCAFHDCFASLYKGGGAMFLSPPSNGQSSFSLSSSSFVGCSAVWNGGSIRINNISDLSISECVFLNSVAHYNGGALSLQSCDFGASSGVSNTLFQNCTQLVPASGYAGGAVRLYQCSTHKFSFVQFRQNAAKSGDGHDFFLYNTSFDSDSFSTCDSTSSNKQRVTNGTIDNSTLLPNPEFKVNVVSLASTLTEDGKVTLTLTLNKAVSGTMIAIVSNVEGTRQEVDGEAPKIGRMLLFSFSSSTDGTCSSSVGELGVLQYPLSDYTLLAASLSNHSVTVPSTIVIPVSPILLHASCDLDASETQVELSFSGFDIPEGPGTLTLNDSITLKVSFKDDEFGKSVGSVQKGVSGKDGDLSEQTDYSLTGIVSEEHPTTSIVIASGVGFSVLEAARLSKVSVSGFVDVRKTKVKLSFESVKLEKNKNHILKMKRTDTSEDTITREVLTDENGVLSDVEEILYPFETEDEGRKEQLQFGVSYGVLSLIASDRTQSVIISDIVISMPDEPPRIFALVTHSLNGKKDQLTLSFQAALFPDGEGTIKVKPTDSDLFVEGALARDSDTQCTAVISTAWTESTTHL